MFHTHPALVQALLDDQYRAINERHRRPLPDLDDTTRRPSARAARKAYRRLAD
jgi:hypothetical protein